MPTSVGAGEGKLTLVAWEGYTEKQWVTPFEKATGCKVSAKYAGSSNDMFNLMTSGGGGQYDMVSASGDASLRLIYAKAVAGDQRRPDPVLQGLLQGVPVAAAQHGRRKALRPLAAVRAERADGQHEAVREGADQLGGDLRPEEQGQDHDPGQPDPDRRCSAVPLEDEAGLGIKDPYELTKAQLAATVALLKQQRPLVKKYWGLASDQIDLFANGGSTIGASWPYQVNALKGGEDAGRRA